MLYLTYAASFISLILGIIEPFAQKMQTVLILSFLSNFLVGISYFFTSSESTSGAVICFIACIQVIINYFFDRKEKKIPMALIVIYALSFIIVSIKVYSAWFDAFPLLQLCFMLQVWCRRKCPTTAFFMPLTQVAG